MKTDNKDKAIAAGTGAAGATQPAEAPVTATGDNDALLKSATESEYKYGFTSDIETMKAPAGLNEDVIRFISEVKGEPELSLIHI